MSVWCGRGLVWRGRKSLALLLSCWELCGASEMGGVRSPRTGLSSLRLVTRGTWFPSQGGQQVCLLFKTVFHKGKAKSPKKKNCTCYEWKSAMLFFQFRDGERGHICIFWPDQCLCFFQFSPSKCFPFTPAKDGLVMIRLFTVHSSLSLIAGQEADKFRVQERGLQPWDL